MRRIHIISRCWLPFAGGRTINKRFNSTSPVEASKEVEERKALELQKEVEEEETHDFESEEFDELEAASQELHDLSFAIISYLRRSDPAPESPLFQRRTRRRFREPVPEQLRRQLHTHGDKSTHTANQFASRKDLLEATDLYCQWCDKLLVHLQKPVMDRLLESAGKGFRDQRCDGVNRRKNFLEKASWRSFPFKWFKHAPFEVEQLRSDVPEAIVKNTRFYRDHSTLNSLFTMMEVKHPYRPKIEARMFEIVSHYNPHK